MRPKPIYVVDLLGEVVEATKAAVIAELSAYSPLINTINYQYGSIEEIHEKLVLMSFDDSKEYQRYPLFALVMSFPENKGQQIGLDGIEELNIIIARYGNNTDKTPARYENNFKPVLYPVYLEFLNQLYLSPKFDTETAENIPHTKIDFPYYNGDKQENVFNSYVDAIQIKIKLKINLKKC